MLLFGLGNSLRIHAASCFVLLDVDRFYDNLRLGFVPKPIRDKPEVAMYDNVNPKECNPPGTHCETVAHPGGGEATIEKAVIMEHRFAFFFWMKWYHRLRKQDQLNQPPTLLTIDWHRDLAPPNESQKEELRRLNPDNLSDVANFVWAQFDQTNDGHVLSAAWLNLIGDIILLKHSASEMQETFTDHQGNEHEIFEFREYEPLRDFLQKRDDQRLFLDIDLDYFIHGKGTREGPQSDDFQTYSKSEIKRIIDPSNALFKYLLPRLDGLTIAQEPAFCGGIYNSSRIMEVVDHQLFDEHNRWRHQAKANKS